jgi:uncharacterized protein
LETLVSKQLIAFARQEFRLDWDGVHGAPHWSRVRHNGLILAEQTGANRKVVEYFAFIHDLGRENDNHDPEHGYRAALIAEKIAGELIDVNEVELELLMDLGRVGIRPDPDRLCNHQSRNSQMLEAAYERSLSWP